MKKYIKDTISIPYQWTTGRAGSAFLTALKDDGVILAARCSSCGKRYLPPLSFCPACFRHIDEYVNAGREGEVKEFTVTRDGRVIGVIQMDGADTPWLHVILEPPEDVKVGMRVRAKLCEQRRGSITDIEGFERVK